MKTKIIFMLAWLFIGVFSHAQTNRTLNDIAETAARTGWIYLKPENKIDAGSLFKNYKNEFGLSAADDMKLLRTYTFNGTGIIQYRYQQTNNNIPVHGAVLNVYEREGIAAKINGRIVKDLHSQPVLISEQTALQKAFEYIPANDYAWLDANRVAQYQRKKSDATASLFPKGELVYMYKRGKNNFTATDYVLCYRFDVAMQRSGSKAIFINVSNGEVVNELPLSISCSGASVNTPMNGSRTIYTSVQGRCTPASDYELWNDCHANNYIKVENDDFGSGTDDPFCRLNNDWSTITGITADAVQVFWGMDVTFNFYNNNFGWYSYDNQGGSVDCTVAYEFEDDQGNPHGKNAQYDEFEEDFNFGYGINGIDATDSYTCLDIVAHEFTHGVDDYTADLDYSDESGALDESYADIMAELIENATDTGLVGTMWLHGEDKGYNRRSFKDPNDYNQPDTYLGNHWHDYNTNSDDHGGVHTNSGVQNFVFYLLSVGKSGINDNGDYYSVEPISTSAITQIAFYSHAYLWGTAEFIDARDAWIEAAIDLYGSCSNEAIQVGNAWHAVGVGAQSPDYTEIVTGIVSAVSSNKTREAIHKVSTLGAVDINSVSGSYEVRFFAANEIELNVGFTATAGTAFKARPNACSITIHNPPKLMEAESAEIVNQPFIPTDDLFTVYPNPATDKVQLVFKNQTVPQSIAIVNALGKAVIQIDTQSMQNGDSTILIDLNIIPSGIYLIEVITGQKQTVKKMIKM